MKKSLLLAFAMIFAMAVNAQEICMWDFDEGDYEGWGGDEEILSAGHVFAQTDNVIVSTAYDDTGKSSAIKGSSDPYQGYTIGGVQYPIYSGVTGSSNPSGTTLTAGPTSGWVIRIDVASDGYLYFLGKLSTNKPYYVWEGVIGEGEMLVAYSLDMCIQNSTADFDVISYTLPGDEYGWYVYSEGDGYAATSSTLNWPEVIYTGNSDSSIKLNGIGLIHFPVYAEAGTYYVHGGGTKITCGGVIFASEALGEIGFTDTAYDDGEEDTGISEVATTSSDVNAPVYNLAGQRVTSNVKGILIQNGKKFINK